MFIVIIVHTQGVKSEVGWGADKQAAEPDCLIWDVRLVLMSEEGSHCVACMCVSVCVYFAYRAALVT